ncbi:hypothetical protein E5288_WYG007544 [Bos mutus]|uniref:Meteorin-like protein n=1 Tax=Bos mutus TaxID=72004 RepID=A0A6B0REZ6_9CETA|nr:hypothetical protein [Bos mutus]
MRGQDGRLGNGGAGSQERAPVWLCTPAVRSPVKQRFPLPSLRTGHIHYDFRGQKNESVMKTAHYLSTRDHHFLLVTQGLDRAVDMSGVGSAATTLTLSESRCSNLEFAIFPIKVLHGGLTHEAHRKEVEQVYLRCSAGTVEWMYPTGALIVNLRPNTFSPSRNLTLCIKPLRGSSGANIYLEKTGELKLLVRDGDLGPGQAPCFGFEQGGLFVEATPQQDISRRTTGFQYELTSRRTGPDLHALLAPCRPCSHTEVLLAVCTSDFVVRGSIQKVTHEPERQESAIHLNVSRLYRQKSRVFRPAPEGEGGGWRGRVSTLLECGVRPGHGEFLFTGHMHFGEAWLGCAPRFKDFQRMYRDAEERGLNPCEMGTE